MKPALALLTALLAACGSGDHPAVRRADPGLVIVDDAGDTVRLVAPATRVVSLSPFTTELAFAIGAGDRLVGRTRWCDYPEAARAVADVGDGIPPNIEAVLARQPDLVLLYLSPQNADAANRLRRAGIPALRLGMDHLADVSRLARLLGPLLGRAEAGDSLAGDFDRRMAELRAAAPTTGPTVLLLAWDQPPIAIGRGSFQSEMLTLAGGRNVFADLATPSAPVSLEAIASRDPDLILTSDSGLPAYARRPEWQAVPAVRDRRFARLATPAFGRPGPRAPDVVRQLAAALREAQP